MIRDGLDHARNTLVANADAVIAVGGGAGTLSEIAFAWMFKRLIVAVRGLGWADRVADQRIDARVRCDVDGDAFTPPTTRGRPVPTALKLRSRVAQRRFLRLD